MIKDLNPYFPRPSYSHDMFFFFSLKGLYIIFDIIVTCVASEYGVLDSGLMSSDLSSSLCGPMTALVCVHVVLCSLAKNVLSLLIFFGLSVERHQRTSV